MGFEKINVELLNENFIKNINSEWMLITAGNKEKFNTMTASWGFTGFMWGVPCAIAAVRPQRYTFEFMEKEEYYTLSFYGNDKTIHSICGKKSGRNTDKIKETGLIPIFDAETGAPYFKQARLVLVCKKLYASNLEKDKFISTDIPQTYYKSDDYHRMFIGEIVSAFINK